MPEADSRNQTTLGVQHSKCDFFGLNITAMAFAIENNIFMKSSSAATGLVQTICTTRKLHQNQFTRNLTLLELQRVIAKPHFKDRK